MAEDISCKARQVLDRMLEFFADDGHWLKGGYDDRGGRAACWRGDLFFCHAWDLLRPRAVSALGGVPRAADRPAIFQ